MLLLNAKKLARFQNRARGDQYNGFASKGNFTLIIRIITGSTKANIKARAAY